MRRLKRAAAALLALGLLVGCTGTSEPQAPTMLLVGIMEGGTPQLALLEDMRELASTSTPRLRFVDGSRRPLPAPAVSVDVTERDGARSSAWVLTRDVVAGGGTPAVSAYLQRFSVAGVDPLAPTAFTETATLTLTDPAGGGLLDGGASPTGHVCPSVVQSNRTGTHVLLLDDPNACGFTATDFPVVWLLNTATGSATVLQGTSPVLGVPPYTDQLVQDERGYFLVGGPAGAAQVYATDFQSGTSTLFKQTREFVDPLDLVDLAGSGRSLLALTRDGLAATDLSEPGADSTVGPVEPISAESRLVVDAFGVVPQVLVMGATRLEVFAELEDDEPESIVFSGAAGTIDPLMRFGYVVGDGQVLIVDLLTGAATGDPLQSRRFPVDELVLPSGPNGRLLSVVTWIRAAEPLPTPP